MYADRCRQKQQFVVCGVVREESICMKAIPLLLLCI